MKKLMLFCIAITMVALVAAPANAEVQNVKVGGDITLRGIYQATYDLNKADKNTSVGLSGRGVTGVGDENATSFMATLGLNVDVDLTDNVSGTIRLVGERDWSSSYETLEPYLYNIYGTESGTDISLEHVRGATASVFDGVQIDLAYITLKELLYSPLTLIIGRQDLWYGDGFIIGANLRPRAIMAPEFTDFRSFDAIRAILDYDPWTVDMFYSRVDEGTFLRGLGDASDDSMYARALVDDSDNIEVWGIDVGYVFDQYNAEAEVYYFGQTIPFRPFGWNGHVVGALNTEDNTVHIVGARGSFEPIDNLDIRIEGAGEFGRVNVGAIGGQANRDVRDVRAAACDVSGAYTWTNYAWLPRLGAGYVFMSGESEPNNDTWNGWINVYRGKFYSAIHEWQGVFYATDDTNASGANPTANNNAWTNQHMVIVDASIQPLDDIILEARYLHFMSQKAYGLATNGIAARNKNIGDEVDLRLTYDYTEDVTFGMLTAWFFPGEYFIANNTDVASEMVASVALTF